MRAISLHEPYASLVMFGWKTIETREHQKLKSLVNQKIIIHATKNKLFVKDADTIVEILSYLDTNRKQVFVNYLNSDYFDKTFGKLLGTVEVVEFAKLNKDNSKNSLIDCQYGNKFGLFLRNPKLFNIPKIYKGSQGIFNIPLEVMKDLKYLEPRKDL